MLATRRQLLAVVAALLILVAAPSAQPLFPSEFLNHQMDTRAFSIAIADLDGVGSPELVVATHGPLCVVRFDSHGLIASTSEYGSIAYPLAVAAADLNADGRLDVVVTSWSDNVYVFLNQGDGTLGPPMGFATSKDPNTLAVGDLDRDGFADLVVGHTWNSAGVYSLLLFRGQGDGTLLPPSEMLLPYFPYSLALADTDADGDLDVLVGQWGLSIFPGNGDGTLGPPVDIAMGESVVGITVADWNEDGGLDVAVANGDPASVAARVLLQQGAGFSSQTHYCAGKQPTGITTGDFDLDGILDLAVSSQTNGWDAEGPIVCSWTELGSVVSIFRGQGDGTFEPPRHFATGRSPQHVVAGDLTGDGIHDLVTVNSSGSVTLLVGDGNLSFGTRVLQPSLGEEFVDTADLNGDGKLDLVTGEAASTVERVAIRLGSGDGTFVSGVTPPFQIAGGIDELAVADLDGGAQDIVLLGYSNSLLTVLHGNGDASFGPRLDYGTGSLPTDLELADVNGDAILDVLVSSVSPNDEILVYLNNGGTLAAPISIAMPAYVEGFATGYLDADTHLDLVVPFWASFNARGIAIRLGNGDGTFVDGTTIVLGSNEYPADAVVSDFDADGHADLVVPTTSYSLSIYPGNGDGTFGQRTDYSVPAVGSDPKVLDVDLDGNLDLVLPTGDNTVAVMRGNGDGTFGGRQDFGAGIYVNAVVAGDFDRNGAPDLAVATLGRGFEGIAVLLNRTTPTNTMVIEAPSAVDLRLGRRAGAIEVRYRIGPVRALVDLRVFDVRGRVVRVLQLGDRDPGEYVDLWDGLDAHGRRVARSTYVVSLRAGTVERHAKAVLLKP